MLDRQHGGLLLFKTRPPTHVASNTMEESSRGLDRLEEGEERIERSLGNRKNQANWVRVRRQFTQRFLSITAT
jgi:hypothetical protein